MSDLIERQKAVDAVLELSEKVADEMLFIDAIVDEIENIPSAEPERGKGEWLEKDVFTSTKGRIKEWQSAKCSVCGKYHTTPYLYYFGNYKYCPNCGAEMR